MLQSEGRAKCGRKEKQRGLPISSAVEDTMCRDFIMLLLYTSRKLVYVVPENDGRYHNAFKSH